MPFNKTLSAAQPETLDYEAQQVNPLVVSILQVLKCSDHALGIHQLLQEIKSLGKLPSLDDDEQLALFKLNWLMMNALYQLQMALLPSAYHLHISTLEIYLQPLAELDQSALGQELKAQPLRDYYLDWKNFSDTTAEEVQAMLDGVWESHLSPTQQSQAYRVLDLSVGAQWSEVKRSYRKLAATHHPDKGGEAQRFMEIRQAYECLKQSLNG